MKLTSTHSVSPRQMPMMMVKCLSKFTCLVTVIYSAFIVSACGGSSSDSGGGGGSAGAVLDINGAITSKYGGQSQMAGWILVASEKGTNITRVAEVDKTGLYTLSKLNAGKEQTLLLLSPNYITTSVLSLPSQTEKTIKQFFTYQIANVPTLIDRGRVLNFQNTTGLSVSADMASDQDGDGKPDGIAGLALTKNKEFTIVVASNQVDTDLDGIPNYRDSDKDGDGVIDTFDPDDDGDAIYDVIDNDADGDGQLDVDQTNSDAFFTEGLEWLSVQLELAPTADKSSIVSTLLLNAKVRDGVNPLAVKVRGPAALLNGSKVNAIDSEGNSASIDWDKQLYDDGLNEDGAADNLLYSRKVILGENKVPRANQVVFIQLMFGSEQDPWYWEFPYAFPSVEVGEITANYDSTTRTVQLVGNPFGALQEFNWVVNVNDQDGLKVYSSEPVLGTTRTITLPENIFETGVKYTFKAIAQVQDKVAGYSPYISNSPSYDIE